MISFVKDVKDRDKELRNLTTQLKYVLFKTKSLFSRSEGDTYIHSYLDGIIKRAESCTEKMDELFKEENISIKEKIRLSLPFDKTKEEIKELIEQLDKGASDLKEHIEDQKG